MPNWPAPNLSWECRTGPCSTRSNCSWGADAGGSYLAQEGTLLLLTGHQISPPEPQLPHQPLQVTDVHVAGFSHPGSRRARAGQGLTLGRGQGSGPVPTTQAEAREGKERGGPPGRESPRSRGCQGELGTDPVSTHPTLACFCVLTPEGHANPDRVHPHRSRAHTQDAGPDWARVTLTPHLPRTQASHHPAARGSGPAAAQAGARGPGARPGPAAAGGCPGSRCPGAVPAPG